MFNFFSVLPICKVLLQFSWKSYFHINLTIFNDLLPTAILLELGQIFFQQEAVLTLKWKSLTKQDPQICQSMLFY